MSEDQKPGMEICAGGADLIPAMAALHAASFDEPWGEVALAEVLAMPGVFMLQATSAGVWLGNDDNIPDNFGNLRQPQLFGFVIARIAADEAEILTVAVDISHRGQGLGRKLMEAAAAAALASGATSLFLEVAEDNLPALALYGRLGFAPVGRRPAYYTRPAGRVAALAMRLGLTKT